VQVTTPDAIAHPDSDSDAVVPAGIGSETTTPAGATAGPAFVIAIE
jgi:hypothetical protein